MTRVLFLWCFLPLSAADARQRDTTYALPQITVTATRLPARLLHAPVRVAILDPRAAPTVSELLSRQSSLYVRQYSGGLATISQRGAAAAQTVVLLDGHRIASPQLGQLDLSVIPTLLLSSVEIISGAGSSVLGTDALAGVLNLRTSTAPPGLRIRVGTGSFGRRSGALAASGRRGRLTAQMAAEYDAADGDYPYLDAGRFPPRMTPRRGADRRRHSLYSALRWEASGGQFRLAGWMNDVERGLPTIHGSVPRRERQWDRHLRLWFGGDRRIGSSFLHLNGLAQTGSLRYANSLLAIDDTGRTFISSIDAEVRLAAGIRWQVATGFSGGYGQARHPRLSLSATEWHGAAFASAAGTYGPLRLYPALRLDAYLPRWTMNPRLGLNLRLVAGLHLKASAGRGFRVPTFNDRFWLPGGNPDLRPERSWTYDMGARWEGIHGNGEFTFFASRTADQILWRPTPEGYWAPENLQRLHTRGLEAASAWRMALPRRFRASGRLVATYVDAREQRVDAPERRVRLLPRHQLKSSLAVTSGAFLLGASARFTGRRSITTDNSSYAGAFLLFDTRGEFRHRGGSTSTSVGVHVDNLRNTRYEYLPSSPMPPREFRLELTLILH